MLVFVNASATIQPSTRCSITLLSRCHIFSLICSCLQVSHVAPHLLNDKCYWISLSSVQPISKLNIEGIHVMYPLELHCEWQCISTKYCVSSALTSCLQYYVHSTISLSFSTTSNASTRCFSSSSIVTLSSSCSLLFSCSQFLTASSTAFSEMRGDMRL